MNEYDAFCSAELKDVRINQYEYQQVIESFLYIAIHTYFDITFALNWLSQYLNNFAKHHEYTLKKLMQYVHFIIDLNIMYEVSESIKLVKYFDSDYILNKLDCKLIFVYIYMLNEESVFWMSWKQKFIITLIIETEYMILLICVKKNLWINQVLKNINLTKYLSISYNHVNILEKITH